jgi:hypothetical protein
MYTGYVEIEVDRIEAIETKYNSNKVVLQVGNLDLYNLLNQYPVEDIIRAVGYDTLLADMDEDDIADWVQDYTKYVCVKKDK